MPVVDDYLELPNSGPPYDDADDAWVVPLGTISGLRLYLSYWVFISVAALVFIMWMATNQEGNADLPVVCAIGFTFWILGWLVQVMVYGFYRFSLGVPIESLTIGILGVESRIRSWTAPLALLVSVSSLAALFATGALVIFAEQTVNGTQPWEQLTSIGPSLGLGSSDYIWIGGAWLLWIQACWQAYPLPKSTGRVSLVAATSMLGQRFNESMQTHIVKRSLQIVSLVTAMVAVWLLAASDVWQSRYWPIFMVIAIVLWVSSNSSDVRLMVLLFGGFDDLGTPEPNSISDRPHTWLERTTHSILSFGRQRHLRRAMELERQEAMDASQLDTILQKLHEHGRESLDDNELAILNRMSENIRRERERKDAEDLE